MKHVLRVRRYGIFLGVAALGGTAAIGHAATANSPVASVVVAPLSLVKVADLDFGNMSAGTANGTATIDPHTDARGASGGVTLMGGTVSAAKFLGYGFRGQRIAITRPTVPVTLTRIGGGATMTIDQLTLNGGASRPLNSAGLVDIRIGGRLRVSANQAPGAYAGSFNLTITYE